MRLLFKIPLLLLFVGFSVGTSAEAGRVLVVHSYHKQFEWVSEINESLEVAFRIHNIPYEIFYMDTKRNPSEAWKIAAAQKAKEAVTRYEPQVVIAVDDNAQAYFVKDYVNNSATQFVFCGVNANPGKYGYPATNVSGILERTYFRQGLNTLKAIIPQIRRVAVVSDDSTTSNIVLQRIQRMPSPSSPDSGITVTQYLQPTTFAQWKQTIQLLEKDSQVDALLIPLFHTVKKGDKSTSVDPNNVLGWTLAHCTKPMLGLWPFFVNRGGLMAVTIDPKEHGHVAAQMAIEILGGKRAGQIPMRTNEEGHVMINLIDKDHLVFDADLNLDLIADQVIR